MMSIRSASLLSLLLAQGCLYIGGLNHAPEIESVVGDELSSRCGSVTVRAVASDPDGDSLSYRWTVAVESVEPAAKGRFALRQMVSSSCDGTAKAGVVSALQPGQRSHHVFEGATLTLAQLPLRGSYQILLEVEDPDGASRSAEHQVDVPNKPPEIMELELLRDPAFVDDKVPDLTGRFPVHAHYRAWVRDVIDHEGDVRCGRSKPPVWELLAPAVVPRTFSPVPCKEGDKDELRFLLPSEALASGSTTLRLRVSYDDGQGGTSSRELSQTVHANRPPCIDALGAQPPSGSELAAKPIPVVHELGRVFDASLVNDDVPQGLSFTWLVRDAGSSTFSVVQGQSGPIFEVPPWFRPSGQQLELRAIVSEPGLEAPLCEDDQALCALPEAFAPKDALKECYAWVTWRLSFI